MNFPIYFIIPIIVYVFIISTYTRIRIREEVKRLKNDCQEFEKVTGKPCDSNIFFVLGNPFIQRKIIKSLLSNESALTNTQRKILYYCQISWYVIFLIPVFLIFYVLVAKLIGN